MAKKRLSRALHSDEGESYVDVAPEREMSSNTGVRTAAVIENGSFGWTNEGPECLVDINLAFPAGKLIGIVGQAGCGKDFFFNMNLS